MSKLSLIEFKIVMLIARKTFGFLDEKGNRKTEDRISLSQFETETGLSEASILKAIKSLVLRNYLKKEEGKYSSKYSLIFEESLNEEVLIEETAPLSQTDTKETNTKEKETKETNTKEAIVYFDQSKISSQFSNLDISLAKEENIEKKTSSF